MTAQTRPTLLLATSLAALWVAAPRDAAAWDPTLPQHPTTYPVNPGLSEGPVANFRKVYVDPYGLKDQLKPDRIFERPKPVVRVAVAADRFVISDKIQFETGSAVVKAESSELLDALTQALNSHPGVSRVRVEGHTDDVGDDAFNLSLSGQRAEAVVAALVQRGVAAERLVAVGKGETEPLEPGTDDDARTANRRVEFMVEERVASADPEATAQQAALEDAAAVRRRLRAERDAQQKLPERGDLPIRNETTSYADITINGMEIGRMGPLTVGLIRDLPSGWYNVESKLQNGIVRTTETRTEAVTRPVMPGSAEVRPLVESGERYSWHDQPGVGHVPAVAEAGLPAAKAPRGKTLAAPPPSEPAPKP